MKVLFDKEWLEEQIETLPLWKKEAYQAFSSLIADNENTYPCIPARQGFLSNNLRFSFMGDPREVSSAKELAQSLKEYRNISRETGKYASLAVFVETPKDILERYNVEDYRKLFWSILNNVTSFDEKKWPEGIPTDPSDHKWEFCFDGEPYFAFCATPAHQIRQSRYFPCLMLAFQPRWVFDEINDSTVFGRKMKKLIRKRLVEFDGVSGHPDLKWYGAEDNHEWKQYFLSDDDSSPSKCPFTSMKNKFSGF
ncbi:YqcI/YcgG family protein [Metabacillus litoralis]|uniref:YqcI/YcgG family protein n=1 Tax=Metabacillus litoralis TaxID=152268 RepID=UPI001CFD5980|nr:YqcI/YcgG family protein [Metabacillus litoralis]